MPGNRLVNRTMGLLSGYSFESFAEVAGDEEEAGAEVDGEVVEEEEPSPPALSVSALFSVFLLEP